jgi:type I restriction enzyme M protein
MLDNITKKNIDDCRDVLVGKVPDPKSQIEQITLALIYKFMDDMDKEAVEKFKGKAKFFTGDYAKFGWRKLFDPSLGGKEMLDLYSEALDKLQTNANIPELFRNIFKNAYLPYKDPATLKMFLKHINEFEYSHSEKLGDAFEYLLSVMGSQGDAGQFRTPRNVIDFLVACVNPQKNETIADVSCGTAGFLLSAFKFILNQNTDKRLGDKLTPDQRKKLYSNFTGYDISPDMVRLSLVNMYLHGFPTPNIIEYDTLSSEDRWNETFDVILANPPFMTPKGGIRPHKKFGVQANKAEVLFTDYIAEHLNKNGRAGIVVPNGIVATTQTAYKQLRKLLVEDSLIAVISLPAGCFNPYSGVKTSILMLDKGLAKKSEHILFIKVNNDGFDLGAQRREIDKNDLPNAQQAFSDFKQHLVEGKPFNPEAYNNLCLLVEKEKILANKDIVLSGDRYVEGKVAQTEFELVKIGDVFKTSSGGTPLRTKSEYYNNGTIPWLKSGEVAQGYINHAEEYISQEGMKNSSAKLFPVNSVLVAMYGATAGQVGILKFECTTNQAVCAIYPNERVIPEYLYYVLKQQTQNFVALSGGGGQPNISQQIIKDFEIPLPPIEIQEQIVKEIEGYQKIIDGAKMVVDNYKPTISINPDWEMVELGSVCEINEKAGDPLKLFGKEKFSYIDIESVENGTGIVSFEKLLDPKDAPSRARRIVKNGDVALSTVRPNLRAFGYLENLPKNCLASTGFAILSANDKTFGKFLFYTVHQDYIVEQMITKSDKGQYPSVTANDVQELNIYLPSLEEQSQIVQRIEQEQALVNANKQLITLFEQKIKDKINEVWGVVPEPAEVKELEMI